MKRAETLDELGDRQQTFDIVVVGGGATGLGTALDAAGRGYRVALLEQHDFAKGTTSRSTKLVHGGVRYLRQGNVPLVRQSLHERGRLIRNAPHLVHDQAFVIPAYTRWDGMFYGLGLKVYDRLAGKLGLQPSRMLSRKRTIELLPTIETDRLIGGVLYHDGQFDDSRLAINLAQTAGELGACLANYCRCVGLLKQNARVSGVVARDEETGVEWPIRARVVVNATGVFADTLRQFDDPASRAMVAVSQGIHFVLPREFLPGEAALMVPKTADGRVLFAVPWKGVVVVGTTDTPRPQIDLEPRALPAECDFVMEHARRYLAKDPADEDVLSVFAGLRPLVQAARSVSTASLSRDHTIVVSSSGLVTITGGKWTSYRKMAQDVVDRAAEVGQLESRPSPTEHFPIHGWTQGEIGARHLHAYGADAARIIRLRQENPQWVGQIHSDLPVENAEVIWQAREEMARTVEDVLARRTRCLLLNARASIQAAPAVAALLARELDRDDAWQADQVARYTQLARRYIYTDPSSRDTDTPTP